VRFPATIRKINKSNQSLKTANYKNNYGTSRAAVTGTNRKLKIKIEKKKKNA
jgi:hypothetical protein